jgi:hypothetical protein
MTLLSASGCFAWVESDNQTSVRFDLVLDEDSRFVNDQENLFIAWVAVAIFDFETIR